MPIKPKMQSILERGRSFLTTRSSTPDPNGFCKAQNETELFPKPDPAVDGEECLHDCSSCTAHLPAKWSIDEDDKLYGHVNGWDQHLVVGTGKTDWVRDVTDEKGSVMQAVGKYGQEIQLSEQRGKGKVMLSASNMPTGGDHGDCDMENGSDCLLLPSWTFVEAVQPTDVPDLMGDIIEKSITNKTPVLNTKPALPPSDSSPASAATNGSSTTSATENGISHPIDLSHLNLTPSHPLSPKFRTRPIPHAALILMCSHKTRDARCGQSAPLLRKELERHLRPLGLYRDLHDNRPGGVGIYFINHVGGHKYSANVMIYRRQGSFKSGQQSTTEGKNGQLKREGEAVQGIWLARVRPEDCENLVRYTVLQGKVVKPERQLRGGFDRERGVASW